ncbi:ATP-binding cassette sub-family G member 1-like [Daphnia pulicaria]|uniref:ATP-binding cassette sub-family G member 1-like n=1 Tax=Daphnia pulicaria TaxID=35523 RepID=UPI001EEB28E9|nr:ATP-binding cassette sub-family G member 1-like [Daphnia pulicaria]
MEAESRSSASSSDGTKTQKYNKVTTTLDLGFRDLCFTTGKGEKAKRILHKMSGAFKSGQLTAILGPSGAGKTSLMNILAGLKTSGVEGRVQVNGAERDLKIFRKRSAYITQKDHLLSNLTVDEYMLAAAHLKLGNGVSNKKKESIIENVMTTLGLNETGQTRISCLSGGECKRLSIALELVNNPTILFLDEPTSGLDSSSSFQCVSLLRDLARSGRTVVTTIHQPSSRLLEHFDHLYIVAGGSCMYQGPVQSLVPYLHTMNLNCPSYHNPADFAMDIASGEYGDVLSRLVTGIENGRLIYQESPTPTLASPSLSHDTGFYDEDEDVNMLDGNKKMKKKNKTQNERLIYAAPFHTQVAVLLGRTWRTIWREKMLTMLRFAAHIVVSILMGMLYWRVGDDAAVIYNNAGLLFFNQLFILFAAMMPTIVTFPLERKVLVREHLNHWYSLKAYYLAKTLADIPFQIVFPTLYLVTVYLMTNQPMSIERFGMLLAITICMSLVAQGIGLLVGAAFSIQVAVFVAPACAIPFLLFSGFFVNLNSIPPYMSWIADVSFFRYAFQGSMVATYGFDRPPLTCSQAYCHFRYAQKFLEQFDLGQSSYYMSVVGLLIFFILIRVAGYVVLRFKLRHVRN